MRVAIYVRPGSRQSGVGGQRLGALIVSVAEQPTRGNATTAALAAVAQALGVPKNAVTLVRGHSSRNKIIEIPDSAAEAFTALAEQ
jgi:uncharacterized protein YggU (UPF0235/DUF167 family)